VSENALVTDGLFALDRKALQLVLAGQDCMKTLPLLWQKARQVWDSDAMADALAQAEAKYAAQSGTEQRLMLWLRCTEYFQLTPRIYETRDDWAAATDELVAAAVRLRKA
jgi:hypothetical protein